MVDYPHVVEDIRSFLQAVDQTYSDELRDLAAAYATACREANARLRRCEEFLQKGLRSEAIHLAQAEPVLLDFVAALDFPELDTWHEVVVAYGLPVPPRLMLATAEALNEAYTVVQPLEHLLKKHRRLALGRAPLPERLAVLRQIAALDGGNPIWAEDIRAFEGVRVRQLEQEVETALYNQDGRALERAFGEIRSSPWAGEPPVGLIERVEGLARRASQQRLRESLQAVANEVHAAVAAGDVDRVRRLRDRWNEEALKGGLDLDDPLWSHVGSAFEWLSEQDRRRAEERKHKAALLNLETALNDNAAPEELDRLYRAAVLRNGGVPEALEGLYHAKVKALRAARARRRRQVMAVCLAGGLVLGAAVGFMAYGAVREGRVRQRVETLKGLRDAGEWEEAARYLDRLDADEPGLAAAPELALLRKQVATEVGRERQRVADFEEAVREAGNAPPGERDKFEQAVTRARALSRLPEEKRAVERLTRARAEKASEWQRRRDREFQDKACDLGGKIGELESPKAGAKPDALLDKLQAEVAQLAKEAHDVSESLRGLPTALQTRIDAVRAARAQGDREGKAAQALTEALQAGGNDEAYVRAVRAYLAEFPATPRANNLRRALADAPLWQAALAWGLVLPPVDPLRVSFAEARATAEKVRAFQKARPASADAGLAAEYLRFLEAFAQQDEDDAKSAAAALREVFRRRTVRDVWILQEGDKIYYLGQDPRPKILRAREEGLDLVGVHYLSGLDGKEVVRNVPRDRITKTYRAPQSELADAVLRLPAGFADPDWEGGTMKVAQMVRDQKGLDPVLQLSLLKEVLALAPRGSPPLTQALAGHQRLIQQANLDLEVPWLNPVSDSARRVRPLARKLVGELPPFQTVPGVVAAQKKALGAALRRSRRELVGWLAWEGDGWQVRPGVMPVGERVLGVVTVGADKTAVWKPVGKLAGGKASLTDVRDATLVEGELVFAAPAGSP